MKKKKSNECCIGSDYDRRTVEWMWYIKGV